MEMTLEDMVHLAQATATDVWGPRDPVKILDKLQEELDELCEAISSIDMNNLAAADPMLRLEVIKELGDVLFCIARFADQSGINPKDALALTIVKIQERNKFGVANVRKEESQAE